MNSLLSVTAPVRLSDPVNREHPLNEGCVAWWLVVPGLEGGKTWYDLMGLYHATLLSMGSNVWARTGTRPGSFGSVLFSEGANLSGGLVADRPGLRITGTRLTLSTWMRGNLASTTQKIIHKTNGTNGYELNTSVTGPAFFRINATTGTRLDTSVNYPGDGITWWHLVGTYDGTNMRVYIDGELDGTLAATAAIVTNTADLRLGNLAISGTDEFHGNLDDMRIYDRALSAAEVRQMYDLSRRGYPGVLNRLESRVISVPATTFRVAWAMRSQSFIGGGVS